MKQSYLLLTFHGLAPNLLFSVQNKNNFGAQNKTQNEATKQIQAIKKDSSNTPSINTLFTLKYNIFCPGLQKLVFKFKDKH